MVFRALSVDEGLSQGTIRAITEDSKGSIWVGTDIGLNRLVGKHVTVFLHSDEDSISLPADDIKCLTVDSLDNLWIGTGESGIASYSIKTNKFRTFKFFDKDGKDVSGALINRIIIDGNDLWAAAYNFGLFHIDLKTRITSVYPIYSAENAGELLKINDIFMDRGELWVGVNKEGLILFDRGKGILRHHWEKNQPNGLNFNNAWRIIPGQFPDIWVGTAGNYFHKVNRVTGESTVYDDVQNNSYNPRWVSDLVFQGSDSLWLATTMSGLLLFHVKEGRIEKASSAEDVTGIAYNSINDLYLARNKILWVGTNGKGLSYNHPGFNHFTIFSKKLKSRFKLDLISIRSIYADNDWVFIGGYNGLNRINKRTRSVNLIDSAYVGYSICEVAGNPDKLIIGTEGDFIYTIDKKSGKIHKISLIESNQLSAGSEYTRFIFDIIHLEGNKYLLGHSTGLIVYELAKEKLIESYVHSDDPHSIVSGEIKCLVREPGGTIWVGSATGGLAKFLPESGKFVRAVKENGFAELPSDKIFSFGIDRLNRFWIGTDKGLSLFDPETGLKKTFNKKDGLPDANILAIEADKNNHLWCSCGDGIFRIDPEREEVESFGTLHGLPGKEFNKGAGYIGPDETLYFGGPNGVVAVSSEMQAIKFPEPIPYIIGCKTYNVDMKLDTVLPYTNEIIIGAGIKHFSVEVTGMDNILDEKNHFMYSIPENSDAWIDRGTERTIHFTGLGPGTYHLNLMVSNNEREWIKTDKPLTIKVKPFFYQTLAVKLLLVLLFLGMVVMSILLRTRYLVKQGAELNRLVDLKTSELRESESQLREANATKDRFFSIIAHDLRSPFNALLGLSELLSEDWDEYPDSEKKIMIGMMQENLSSTFELLTNLLDWSRLQRKAISAEFREINLKLLAENAIEGIKMQSASKGILVNNRIDESHIVFSDQFMVETILRNLLNNAIKFTPKEGSITLTSELRDGGVRCCVSDTGIGMSPEMQKRLFKLDEPQSRLGTDGEKGTGLGLLVCLEFMQLLNGKLEVSSREGEGSTFCIFLPGKEAGS
jgi:signal transduction histidine kinase/ligand-binding sensor domain-containing protein